MASTEPRVGQLRSKIEMTLHTYPAVLAWHGRGVESGKPQVVGLKQFLSLAGRVHQAAGRDDPYADNWLIMLEEKVDETRQSLQQLETRVSQVLKQIPEGLDVSRNVSQQPFLTPVFTGGQMGWQAVMLLMQYDSIVRDVLLANHIGLLGNKQRGAMIRDQGGHALRSLCYAPVKFPGFSGATRDDFAANNAKARNALEKYGELPQDILEGTRRSEFAPTIRREAGLQTGSDQDHKLEGVDLDDDQLLTQPGEPES
ncbi:MAG: TIGR03761 family integrating conjugative element protein [Pseudomonadota bacterium]|jgi:integrating conjugative element protein (TIGR03761 family)|uniref:PFL_4669 family integrating conjugative element protein n=1 Tax=Salinicola sp. TaxID=1978524 RepID=UPI001D4935CA|nr:TIGR03761 family integrating conjugative element protein [Salinicola sp.]MEC8917628.1 TIGR03761 family integrating conjugative element protein [Pseudomonadota bacterium]NRB55860.1 TIGR03761 family integrating conjugative element protein [Salinicola sp.]